MARRGITGRAVFGQIAVQRSRRKAGSSRQRGRTQKAQIMLKARQTLATGLHRRNVLRRQGHHPGQPLRRQGPDGGRGQIHPAQPVSDEGKRRKVGAFRRFVPLCPDPLRQLSVRRQQVAAAEPALVQQLHAVAGFHFRRFRQPFMKQRFGHAHGTRLPSVDFFLTYCCWNSLAFSSASTMAGISTICSTMPGHALTKPPIQKAASVKACSVSRP